MISNFLSKFLSKFLSERRVLESKAVLSSVLFKTFSSTSTHNFNFYNL